MPLRNLFTLTCLVTACIGTDYERPLEPSVRIIRDTENLYQSTTHQFTAEFLDFRGGIISDTIFQWESSNPAVLTINSSGLAQGMSEGIANISASLVGITGEQRIVVLSSEEHLEILGAPDTLFIGQSANLGFRYIDPSGIRQGNGTGISWTVGNDFVMSVTSSGMIRGLGRGVSTVVARGIAVVDSVVIRVIDSVDPLDEALVIQTFPTSLEVGQTFQMSASFFDSTGMENSAVPITWSSNNPTIASITGSGLVEGLTVGSTTISASAQGLEDEVSISVTSTPMDITRTGLLEGRGYDISGGFELFVENDSLYLEVTEASIDSNAPGPYFYLSNQDESVSGGINLGQSQNGDFVINITRDFPSVELFTYDYFVVWCEPFRVTLGVGQFQ